jgi:hypothetical protein
MTLNISTLNYSKKEPEMAKVRNNIFVRGLSGSVGDQFVVKQDRNGRTIISNSPTFKENREFTEAQRQQQEKFREAAEYAKEAKTQQIYVDKSAETARTPYNVAMADFFHGPEILELDLDAWDGEVGQILRIKVMDDVKVTQVNVVITDGTGVVLEQGPAIQSDNRWWNYTTTATAQDGSRVVVTARDLPGNLAEFNWED